MKAGKVVGRVVATIKNPGVEGKKILLLKPMKWEEIHQVFQKGSRDNTADQGKSIVALDAVGAGAGEYVFYVSSREACHAFEDAPICHNAVVGIIDGVVIRENEE